MHTLQKIKRKNLDVDKYSKALNDSFNYRIYAEYWYLDVLTKGKWECLVYGDYEVIMPLPLQFKFGIKFISQPIYCQQLGIFYKEEISQELFNEFEKRLHKYRVRSYCFNEENTQIHFPKGTLKSNYILNLTKGYEEIYKDYRKNRKSDVKKLKSLDFELNNEFDFPSLIDLLQNEYERLASKIDLNILKELYQELRKRKKCEQKNVVSSNELLASSLFLNSRQRIIYLLAVRNKKDRNTYAKSLILDTLFKENQTYNYLDFEGSVIPGIAEFYKSFGAEERNYCVFKNI